MGLTDYADVILDQHARIERLEKRFDEMVEHAAAIAQMNAQLADVVRCLLSSREQAT